MGIALVQIKIMPSSPEADLNEIKSAAETIIKEIAEPNQGIKTEENPIAFGLKALMISFAMNESKELDPIEFKLREIPNVTSAEVEDFRRAFG